jgi:hypothetical protein
MPTGLPVAGFTTLANPQDGTRARSAAFGYQIMSGGSGATVSAGAFGNTASSLTPPTASIATFKVAATGPPPQTLRPDADTDADSWTTTPLWSKVDEASAGGDVITATAS